MKYLITNADDYGYRPDISQAIVDAHQHGVLTSTTVLINFVTAEEVELAKSVPSLGLGLHLNVTSGEPLTKNWQEKYGAFSRPFRNESNQFDREVWLPFFARYKTDDVFQEYEVQYQQFLKLFGKAPTHVDTHHYHSSFPSTFPAYIRLAKKYKLPVRLPKMWEVANKQHLMGNITTAALFEKHVGEDGVVSTNYFSVEYLNRYEEYLTVFKHELEKVKDGQSIEISFHPGHEEEWRKKDLEILKDPKVRDEIEKNGFTLITFKELPTQPSSH